jgi:thioredoxin 1
MRNISKYFSFALCASIVALISISGCNESSKPGEALKTTKSRGGDLKDEKRDAELKSSTREKPKVIFVELGSKRCIPCRMMEPIIREIEEEYRGQVRFVYYDVYTPEGRVWADHYEVRAVPTLVFLDKHRKEYFRHEGFFPKKEIVKVLRKRGVR